jgi:hypothetical protein
MSTANDYNEYFSSNGLHAAVALKICCEKIFPGILRLQERHPVYTYFGSWQALRE